MNRCALRCVYDCMHIPFLILFALMPQQDLGAELRRQQQQLQDVQRQLRESQATLATIEQEQQALAKLSCSAELQLIGGDAVRTVSAGDAVAVRIGLFSTVSRPVDTCLPADIRMTVSYLDSDGALVCTGAIDRVAVQREPTQHIGMEIRPWNFFQFVWWRNQPPETNTGPVNLSCMNPNGVGQVLAAQLDRVVSVRIWTTVLPPGGGLSTVELALGLQR